MTTGDFFVSLPPPPPPFRGPKPPSHPHIPVVTLLQIGTGKCQITRSLKPVFRIRMDPGFFADPDPGIKSPDPSINKLHDGFDKVFEELYQKRQC